MREILFRGKTYNGEWVYGYCYKIQSLLSSDFKWYIRNNYQKDNIVITETIGQYTGLKDKNGKKIFEGDIVNIYDWGKKHNLIHTGEIYWKKEECQFELEPYLDCDRDDIFMKAPIEVIGNIYDKEVK